MSHIDTLFSRRSTGIILFVAFLLLWAMLTKVHTYSWQEESRMATVQALVEQGTFVIDHTPFNRTGDKVFVNGHFYSDKTPLLSVAAAGVYSILRNGFGLTLDPAICVPDEDTSACRAFGPAGVRLTAFYWLTLIFMGGSSALLVALFWKAMIGWGWSGLVSTGLAIALGLASPIAPYSIVFAGHVPAALCLFAGFMLLARCHSEPCSGEESHETLRRCAAQGDRRLFWAGVLVSLSANIDLTLAAFIIAFGVWALLKHRARGLLFALGAGVPFAVSAAINYWAAGTIVPLYFDPNAYDFYGTVLNKTVGGTDGFYSLDFGLRYTYNLLIGQRGLFSFTPLLVYALIGVGLTLRDRRSPLRGLSAAVIAAWIAFTLYLIFRTDNFGGVAWGTRWFVPIAPVVWAFVPRASRALSITPRLRPIGHIVFAMAVIVSFLTVVPGLHDAWRIASPIIQIYLPAGG